MDLSKKRKNSASRGKGLRSSTSAGKDEQRTIEVEDQQPALLTEEQIEPIPRKELTYSDFRKAYPDIQGNLFGMAERYITALDWTEVAAKVESDEETEKRERYFLRGKNIQQEICSKRVSKITEEMVGNKGFFVDQLLKVKQKYAEKIKIF